jgi:hypothetical protein
MDLKRWAHVYLPLPSTVAGQPDRARALAGVLRALLLQSRPAKLAPGYNY